LIIGGERQTSETVITVRAPYDDRAMGQTNLATAEQVEQAIAAATAAAAVLAKLPSYQRAEILLQAAALLRENAAELVDLLAGEAGKPIKAAQVEVGRAAQTFTIAAEESKRRGGEVVPLDLDPTGENRIALVRRFPIGPITAITPFNFPLNLAAHKLAPALAVGNPVVLKSAPQTPLITARLGEILLQAGWPPAGLSVISCTNEVAQALVTDPRMKMLSFTGSVAVGWQLRQLAADRRVTLELGGNAAVVVHQDADLDFAAERCAVGGFGYAGQSCISVQRIYVHRPVYDEFMTRLLAATARMSVGNPWDPQVDVGPMINAREAQRAVDWIQEAITQGATLLMGGQRQGALLWPTVLADVSPTMKVSCQEIFAPVVAVSIYDTWEAVYQYINDSAYGLQTGIFTRDVQAIFQAYETLQVGGVVAGDIPTYRADHLPYGGVKQSGQGREGLRYAMEEMTELKSLVIKWR
jgi:glyceraldehyde-3-phosphate dehydrogenase (NADP+)